jgi:hypothetical protein
MVDGFPLSANDSDHAIQLLIDAELQNAVQVRQAYSEKRGPFPHDDVVHPQLRALADRGPWLMPLYHRLEWHCRQAEPSIEWLQLLAKMVVFALKQMAVLNDEQFLALTKRGPVLGRHTGQGFFSCMATKLSEMERNSLLSQEVTAAAYDVLLGAEKGRWTSEMEHMVWPLLSGGTGLAELDRGWSAHIVRDLHNMKPKARAVWLRAFNPTWYWRKMNARIHAQAIETLGKDAIEQALRRWVAALATDAGDISPIGAVLIRHVIRLCEVVDGNACDELLYEIARAPWTRITVPTWPYLFLETMHRRPKDRAFACLEAMAMNPVLADHRVQREYNALLTVFAVRESADMNAPAPAAGVDGYPLDRDPALYAQQVRIDQLLRMASVARDQMRAVEKVPPRSPVSLVSTEARSAFVGMVEEILKEFAGDPKALHAAATARTKWLWGSGNSFAPDTLAVWQQLFFGLGCGGGLVQLALARVDSLSLDQVMDALGCGGGETAFDRTQKYVAANGWTPDLVKAVRRWIPSIGSAASDQIYRARAEWFVWWEDVCPIVLDDCWSHRMKRDIRAMNAEDRANWRVLLEHTTFKYTGEPPRNWLDGADAAFAKVGLDEFRCRFLAWFEPFLEPEVFRITITGRNLLRLLMWYALIAKDDAVDQTLATFANVKWKTKESANRAALAEMAFSYVLSQRAPESSIPILEKYVASGQAFEGSKMHKVYEELCARWSRTPVAAIPQKKPESKSPAEPKPVLVRASAPPLPGLKVQ